MSDKEVILKVDSVSKAYGDNVVLENVSTEVCQGDVIAIIGPSGCGKSTFIRMLNMLETPDSGTVFMNEVDLMDKKVDINKMREKIGMVFQHFNLFPNLTIKENIALAPIKTKRMSKEEANKRALELLERVGLSDKADAYPDTLSGGQKQRVEIGRAHV